MDKCLRDIIELIRGNENLIEIEVLSEYIKYELEKKKTTLET
ncbi:hypothetical protein [Hathewaya massiliensis]|nr:hypothetical protein [Hathewaya massiliensis]